MLGLRNWIFGKHLLALMKKKGSRVFLTHAGKARETLLALDVKKINCEPVAYTNCLKNLYLKDRKKQPLRRMTSFNNSVKDCWIRLIEYVFIFSCISIVKSCKPFWISWEFDKGSDIWTELWRYENATKKYLEIIKADIA